MLRMVISENLRKRTKIRDHIEDVGDLVLTSLPHLIFQVAKIKIENVERKVTIENELSIEIVVIVVIRKDINISKRKEGGVADHTLMMKNLKIVVDIEK